MSRIRSTNTKPELWVRKELFARGFRYRINDRKLPGTPDIVLPKYRTVIFVNGCFWHGHEGCKYYTHPKTNPEFWESKVLRNKTRDARDIARLEGLNWSVIVVWECELKKERFEATIERVVTTLPQNRDKWMKFQDERNHERARIAESKKQSSSKKTCPSIHVPKSIIKLSEQEEEL